MSTSVHYLGPRRFESLGAFSFQTLSNRIIAHRGFYFYNVVLPRTIAPVCCFLPPPRLGISLVVSRCIPQYKEVHRGKGCLHSKTFD